MEKMFFDCSTESMGYKKRALCVFDTDEQRFWFVTTRHNHMELTTSEMQYIVAGFSIESKRFDIEKYAAALIPNVIVNSWKFENANIFGTIIREFQSIDSLEIPEINQHDSVCLSNIKNLHISDATPYTTDTKDGQVPPDEQQFKKKPEELHHQFNQPVNGTGPVATPMMNARYMGGCVQQPFSPVFDPSMVPMMGGQPVFPFQMPQMENQKRIDIWNMSGVPIQLIAPTPNTNIANGPVFIETLYPGGQLFPWCYTYNTTRELVKCGKVDIPLYEWSGLTTALDRIPDYIKNGDGVIVTTEYLLYMKETKLLKDITDDPNAISVMIPVERVFDQVGVFVGFRGLAKVGSIRRDM